jgi:hypothetical protein
MANTVRSDATGGGTVESAIMATQDSDRQPASQPSGGLFGAPEPQRAFPVTAVAIGAVALVIVVGTLVLLAHRGKPAAVATNVPLPQAAYAANLVLSGIEMSEANSQLGGTSTYIDGHIVNKGTATVTGIMAQVLFPNDDGTTPQRATTQMLLIRAREPYIDTEMISAAPIPPGGEADFRLIFESVPVNWNTHPPDIHLTEISTP